MAEVNVDNARSHLSVLFFILGAVLSVRSVAQCNVPAPTKDAAAISALTQMVSATGWNLQSLPVDAMVNGSLTLYRTDGSTSVRSVTLKAKGNVRTRVDTAAGDTPISTLVVNDSTGAALNQTGASPISSYAAISTRAFFLPFFTDLAMFVDPSVSVSFAGDEIVGGLTAHKVQVSRIPDPNDITCSDRALVAPLTVWLGADNGLPIQLQYPLYSNSPDPLTMVTRRLDSWQTIAGLAVPLHQSEYANGQLRTDLTITSVTFNVGLTDDIFDPGTLIAQ